MDFALSASPTTSRPQWEVVVLSRLDFTGKPWGQGRRQHAERMFMLNSQDRFLMHCVRKQLQCLRRRRHPYLAVDDHDPQDVRVGLDPPDHLLHLGGDGQGRTPGPPGPSCTLWPASSRAGAGAEHHCCTLRMGWGINLVGCRLGQLVCAPLSLPLTCYYGIVLMSGNFLWGLQTFFLSTAQWSQLERESIRLHQTL